MSAPAQTELNRIACGISEAYINLISSYSSFTCKIGTRDKDNLAIDGDIKKITRIPKNGKFIEVKDGNIVEFQLKSCYGGKSVFTEKGNVIRYKIGKKFFDKLELNQDRFILIILRLPPATEFEKWLEIKEDYTKLQKCAYFRSVSYSDQNDWIEISKNSLLNPENLHRLFVKPKPTQ